ncbi:YihY/virulence factor BrkB family protein [Ornithinimicrobium cryptoxanthini]|uniref:YihY/virulence factor BrkB family protein n=1 Tax=Ornithinimicrobium cryptoxanthini TaxID=2934161 RepID=A0ABY4YHF6_9MICO|nr:YihY/virulence factor BrkB family protein [Ornithinimicrobium cryptoxanthini]USQ76186.1 YihY/virulence factor BrkB family protein [Ornithinimicrobium cryptoxanthini]
MAKHDSSAEAYGAGSVEPRQMPLRGWLLILRRVVRRVADDNFSLYSAGVAFFAVLSIAPVLLTALSVYGAINTPAQALDQLSGLVELLPPALGELVADQLVSITEASTQLLTARGLLALGVALVTATTATTFLIDALTVAYREQETRGMLRRSGLALAFVLGGALVLGAVITGSTVVSGVLSEAPTWVRVPVLVGIWIGLAALVALGLSILYRFAPDRRGQARWRWISRGAIATTALWLAASAGLFFFVWNLGTYERTYGSLAGVAISMFWIWLTVLVLILGAALNAETERQTARDTTIGAERPPGQRGAVVADDIPPHPEDPN